MTASQSVQRGAWRALSPLPGNWRSCDKAGCPDGRLSWDTVAIPTAKCYKPHTLSGLEGFPIIVGKCSFFYLDNQSFWVLLSDGCSWKCNFIQRLETIRRQEVCRRETRSSVIWSVVHLSLENMSLGSFIICLPQNTTVVWSYMAQWPVSQSGITFS